VSDNCPDVPNPDQADGDHDGIGDACDPCTNIVPVFVTKPKLKLTKQAPPSGDEGLLFKGTMVVPTVPTIDPTTKGVRFLLADATGTNVIDVTIPGGTGWKANGKHTRWSFKSATGVQGITKVQIASKPSAPGSLKFSVKGKHGAFTVSASALPVTATLVIDAPLAKTGQCGEATPTCRSTAKGKTIRCQ
jgi:hypothetical protein